MIQRSRSPSSPWLRRAGPGCHEVKYRRATGQGDSSASHPPIERLLSEARFPGYRGRDNRGRARVVTLWDIAQLLGPPQSLQSESGWNIFLQIQGFLGFQINGTKTVQITGKSNYKKKIVFLSKSILSIWQTQCSRGCSTNTVVSNLPKPSLICQHI